MTQSGLADSPAPLYRLMDRRGHQANATHTYTNTHAWRREAKIEDDDHNSRIRGSLWASSWWLIKYSFLYLFLFTLVHWHAHNFSTWEAARRVFLCPNNCNRAAHELAVLGHLCTQGE
jgi:hypothetical protein